MNYRKVTPDSIKAKIEKDIGIKSNWCQFLVMSSRLLGDYPNTYAYTKAAGEDVVQKYCKGLPVALFRPSIGE